MFHKGTLKTNLISDMDSYKGGQPSLMHPRLSHIETYGEARIGGEYPYIVNGGMQAIALKHFANPVTKYDLDEAMYHAVSTHGAQVLDVEGWKHVINKHGGYLPMTIRQVPEGTILRPGNALFVNVCNDERFAKMMSGTETLQMQVWDYIAVATRGARIKSAIYPIFAYFNVIIDDKSGFEGETDWLELLEYLRRPVQSKVTDLKSFELTENQKNNIKKE